MARPVEKGTRAQDNGKGARYIRISAGPQRGRYVHHLVAEALLRRRLKPGEQVDHRDTKTLNNDPTNIRVFKSVEDHARVTNNGGRVPEGVEVVVDGQKIFEMREDCIWLPVRQDWCSAAVNLQDEEEA